MFRREEWPIRFNFFNDITKNEWMSVSVTASRCIFYVTLFLIFYERIEFLIVKFAAVVIFNIIFLIISKVKFKDIIKLDGIALVPVVLISALALMVLAVTITTFYCFNKTFFVERNVTTNTVKSHYIIEPVTSNIDWNGKVNDDVYAILGESDGEYIYAVYVKQKDGSFVMMKIPAESTTIYVLDESDFCPSVARIEETITEEITTEDSMFTERKEVGREVVSKEYEFYIPEKGLIVENYFAK